MSSEPGPEDVHHGPVRWEEHPLDWPRAAGHVDLLVAAVEVRKRRQRRRRLAIASGGTVTVLLAGLAWLSVERSADSEAVISHSTRTAVISAPARQLLPDGSMVEIDTGTDLSVHFEASQPAARLVRLQHGKAHFRVVKDETRPFIVEARGVEFRAVGTAFAVELEKSSVEMLVTEGKVAVAPSLARQASPGLASDRVAPDDAVVLELGEGVVVDTSEQAAFAPRVRSTSAIERAEKLAWRVPRLQFNETPLSEVVNLIGQHSGTRINLGSRRLEKLAISGALRGDNIEPLLQMLEMNYHIRASRLPGGAIELHENR